MTIISLGEKVNEILQFFKNYDINLSEELQLQMFDFLKKICSYEEEETKIFPHIIIGHNMI